MAAGLGFKDFTTGEVLTAGDVDGYLMQGIWVFASAAARDAAVTSPQEGNFAFLKDTNTTTYYTGSAWTNLDTTGMVNPMTTTGDTIYSSSGSTPARLGIGSTGQVLTVAGGVPSWATPASGGSMTVIQSGSLSGTAIAVTGISGYKDLRVVLRDYYPSIGGEAAYFRLNNNTTTIYNNSMIKSASTAIDNSTAGTTFGLDDNLRSPDDVSAGNAVMFNVYDIANTTAVKLVQYQHRFLNVDSVKRWTMHFGYWDSTSAVTEVNINMGGGASFAGGTYIVYGVN